MRGAQTHHEGEDDLELPDLPAAGIKTVPHHKFFVVVLCGARIQTQGFMYAGQKHSTIWAMSLKFCSKLQPGNDFQASDHLPNGGQGMLSKTFVLGVDEIAW